MTDAATLLALAERVEKLTGPDRGVDEMIAREVLNWKPPAGTGAISIFTFPDFTASLDAAMTLVPEGWWVAKLEQWRTGAPTRTWASTLRLDPHNDEEVHKSGKPSAALAICAVALRALARASQLSAGDRE